MRKKLGYKPMPPADSERSGCKVGWRYYRNAAIAKEAAKIARHNADIDASLGYDFGFQSPGSLQLIDAGEYEGLYEVCVS